MTEKTIAPYGSWPSPITADLIITGTVRLDQIMLDGDDIYWLEGRPAERGRVVLVKQTADGRRADVTPAAFNVRTRVHEYGGGAYVVDAGMVYFVNFADQRLYRLAPNAAPTPITPETAFRYADFAVDHSRDRLICVREDHTSGREAVNTIAGVQLAGDDAGGQVLVSGNDFYASPRLSPDGSRLAWLTWHHPNMPWDGTELWVAAVQADGTLAQAKLIAGGPDESIFQPTWSPDGVLHFVSDRTGWWNLYRWQAGRSQPLCPMAAEFGEPQWVFGMSTYAFASASQIICAYAEHGAWRLASLDTRIAHFSPFALPYTDISRVCADSGRAVFFAGSPTEFTSVVRLDLATGQAAALRRASEVTVDAGYLSIPQEIEYPTGRGEVSSPSQTRGEMIAPLRVTGEETSPLQTAYGFFYSPDNRDLAGPAGERPPLVVLSHGGPTGATSTALRLGIQFWTSRGIAVLDVNYGGSTGYGRAYRERLNNAWGIVDVADCVNGVRTLVERGEVDGNRIAITGGSAGGYTTLCALTFTDVFRAGASHYGVSDLEGLATDTHKFESRYLDRLVGPYPGRRDLYMARSPIHHTDRLARPVIFFQGLEDQVVPPSQSEAMFAAVKARGLPTAYLAFAGEQHGFRQAQNIKRSLEAELYFYSRVFGFALADSIDPVQIENL